MKIICSILLILLFSCQGNNKMKNNEKILIVAENKKKRYFPFIIDTIAQSARDFKVHRDNVWCKEGNYRQVYIGDKKDTIFLMNGRELYKNYIYNHNKAKTYKRIDSTRITIEVDTTTILVDKFTKTDSLKSYPVFIKNITKDTVIIGAGNHFPMRLEAKNEKGIWKPIEEYFIYDCGTGLNTTLLPANKLAIVLVPIFKGSFKIKLRLGYANRWGREPHFTTYSNEFTGTINLTKFRNRLGYQIY